MQLRFSSWRLNPTCSCEKPGDVVEATGGILSAWRPSSGVVVRGGRRWPLEQPQAFHNQRPQAIAATGFPQPCGRRSFPTQACHAATCHVQGSDRGPAGETAVVRSLVTGVGVKASAKKDEVSLPQTGSFFAGMKKAAEQQAIPLLIDLMSARGSAKKNKAVGSDGCPSEFWKYLSCVSMVVIFRLFLMRLLAMEDGRNVDSPH